MDFHNNGVPGHPDMNSHYENPRMDFYNKGCRRQPDMKSYAILLCMFLIIAHYKKISPRLLLTLVFTLFLSPSLRAQNISANADEDPNAGLKIIETQVYPYKGPENIERKLIVKLQIKQGFKAYANKFKIHILEPYPVEEGDLRITPLHKFFDKFTKSEKDAVINNGTLTLPFYYKNLQMEFPNKGVPGHPDTNNFFRKKLNNGEVKLKYELNFQSCTETYCFFPKTIGGETNFAVETNNPGDTAKANSGISTSLLQDTFTGAKERGSLYLFIFVFLAGVLTSLTPCLLPVLPLTLAVLGKGHLHDKKWKKFIHAVIYVLGIAATYSTLGLLAASSGSIFGSTLSNPLVQIGFAVLFILMGIAQFGFVEIQTPLKLQNLFHKWGNTSRGIFLTGLLSGLIASPCVGPVLVGILTFVAQTQSHWLGFGLLFTYALGMGQLLIILGVSSNLLYKFPKSPLIMKSAKTVLGVALVASGLFYLSLLWPKTGTINKGPITEQTLESQMKWLPFTEKAFKEALQSEKPVFIDFYAEWCLACKELEAQTFTSKEVELISRSFIAFKFDATEESEMLTKLKNTYGIVGLPTILFFNSTGEWLKDLTLNEFEKPDAFILRMKKAQ
jgi:thiol:disulfide interchange protein DsbD